METPSDKDMLQQISSMHSASVKDKQPLKNDDKGCAPVFRSICDDSCEVEADVALGEVNNNDTKVSQNET